MRVGSGFPPGYVRLVEFLAGAIYAIATGCVERIAPLRWGDSPRGVWATREYSWV